MKVLSKDEVLAAAGRETKVIEVPNVGALRLASPNAEQFLELQELYARQEKGEDVKREMMRFGLACVVDEDGEQLFDAAAIEVRLKRWSFKAISRLMNEAIGYAADLVKPSKEAPLGNSEAGPAEG